MLYSVRHSSLFVSRFRPTWSPVFRSIRMQEHVLRIKYSDQVVDLSITESEYKISQLFKEAGTQLNIPESMQTHDLHIIHGAHPSLTEDLLESFKSQNILPLSILTHEDSQTIYQPFLELKQRTFEPPSTRIGPAYYENILKHISEHCTHPNTLKQIIQHLIPDCTPKDLRSRQFQSKMKLLYPNLLRFQNVAYSLLSKAERDLLGSNESLSSFEIGQILIPKFVDYFSHADSIAADLLRSKEIPEDMQKQVATRLANLCDPHEWYPLARGMKRKIILHVGPTNSGKTFGSLNALRRAVSGIYCAPLRLLAQEIYEKFDTEGVAINLMTGQSRSERFDATHVSCTVEMANTNTLYECAVIDEIQMIADPDRGWAWTRALMGIPAKEIHLCGNETTIELVRKIAKECGDSLEVKEYKRLSPLKVPEEPLETIYDLQPGDCIIGFSRKTLFAMKHQIQRELKGNCCIIYGRLPPETRSQQAKLFNSRHPDYPYLVATDAIGMGLNLNIKRVVFSTLEKFNGKSMERLSTSEIKQIAGRAGRFKSVYPVGTATSFDEDDQEYINTSIHSKLKQSAYAGIFPNADQIELFALGTQDQPDQERPFSTVLEEFAEIVTVGNEFFLCGFEDVLKIAKVIDDIELSVRDRFMFCMAPCSLNIPLLKRYMIQYASAYSVLYARQAIQENSEDILPVQKASSRETKIPVSLDENTVKFTNSEMAEAYYLVLDLYIWLSWRFPVFEEREKAMNLQKILYSKIEASLENTSGAALKNKPKQKKTAHRKRR